MDSDTYFRVDILMSDSEFSHTFFVNKKYNDVDMFENIEKSERGIFEIETEKDYSIDEVKIICNFNQKIGWLVSDEFFFRQINEKINIIKNSDEQMYIRRTFRQYV